MSQLLSRRGMLASLRFQLRHSSTELVLIYAVNRIGKGVMAIVGQLFG